MCKDTLIVFAVMLGVQQSARALKVPLHLEEARIVEQIISVGDAVGIATAPTLPQSTSGKGAVMSLALI